jgi:predicted amidohydrolase YtcJ
MSRSSGVALVGLSGLLVWGLVAAQPVAPDMVLLHGKVFTSEQSHLHAEALAIRGDRIVAVGTSEEIGSLAGPATRRIDLGGHTVIPGIDDAHAHLDVLPADVLTLPLKGENPTWPEVREAVSAAARRAPKGSILFGEIGPSVFHGPEATRQSLDRLAPDHPVILVMLTGHAAILNSAGLTKMGIREDQPDPAGGRYERTAQGRLSGTVREYAVLHLTRVLGELTSDADAVVQLRDTLTHAAQLGITSVQDMTVALAPERVVALLEKIPTPVRVRVIRMPGTTPAGRDTEEGLSLARAPAPRITVSGTKWLTDGTPLEQSFAPRRAPSGASGTSGVLRFGLLFPRTELEAMLRETLKSGDQLMLHVSGYPAASAMLEAMQATGGPGVWSTRRVRFEHGDGLFADLVPRTKTLGIVVVENPTHLDIRHLDAKRYTPKSLSGIQPLASLLTAGIPLAFGSDAPMNPYRDILLATTHPNRPSEAISREQALIASTLTAAYAEFAETEKGSLTPGKLADLAVLSQDIFTVADAELPKTTSLLTLVGGKVVYDDFTPATTR